MAKNKHRTRKSAVKRFRVTRKGKVLHRSHYLRHLRSKKGRKRIRRLKMLKHTKGTHAKKIKQMLGRK